MRQGDHHNLPDHVDHVIDYVLVSNFLKHVRVKIQRQLT